jgi:hypothetical protein
MLVLVADKLGRRHAHAIQAMPSEQRFAVSVFTSFAVALALLAALFAFSAEPSTSVGPGGLLAHDLPREPVPPTTTASNA